MQVIAGAVRVRLDPPGRLDAVAAAPQTLDEMLPSLVDVGPGVTDQSQRDQVIGSGQADAFGHTTGHPSPAAPARDAPATSVVNLAGVLVQPGGPRRISACSTR